MVRAVPKWCRCRCRCRACCASRSSRWPVPVMRVVAWCRAAGARWRSGWLEQRSAALRPRWAMGQEAGVRRVGLSARRARGPLQVDTSTDTPARVHRRHRLRRPARALRVAAPGNAVPEASRHVDGPAHSAAGAARGTLHPPPHLPPPLAPLPSPFPSLPPQDRPGSLESRRNGAVTSGGGGIRATRREEKCVITFPTLLHQEFSLEIRVFLK